MALILIINASDATDAIRGALEKSGVVTAFDGGAYLRVGAPTDKIDGWLGVMEDQNIENDYDPRFVLKLIQEMGSLRFFILEGKDGARDLARNFIKNFPSGVRAVIDDTRGRITEIEDAKKSIYEGKYCLYLGD